MKRVARCGVFVTITLLFVMLLTNSNSAFAVPATEFNIEVAPVLSVSMSNVNLEASVGALATGTGALSISSNNATGYNTFITSSSSETALIDLSEEYQIPSITTTTTVSNFPTNAWGMSVDGTNYDGITPLGSNTPAITTLSSSVPSTITQNISFAAKVDATTPAGTYSNSILVTVVPNYVPITLTESYNLAGKTRVFGNDGHKYYSMQDMNPTICNTTDKEHSSIQVVDERDNKVYWITKLKDGNCWMTQNLDFNITATNVTPELSDVTTAWNSSSAYPPQATSTEIFNNSDSTGTYSYDPGDKYLPSGTGTATDIDCSIAENKENCHYHQGNYYQYNAATAGTGGTIIDADATSSICPKGWRLPTTDLASANYSFGNLLKQYGYSGSNQDGVTDSTLLASPLFFARGGRVYSGSLGRQDNLGRYWSSRAGSDIDSAYSLNFNSSSSSVNPSYDDRRYGGFSVRCVAHGNILSLSYNANGGTNAPSATIAESNSTSATITIPSTIPTREHYNFLGWATSSTATTPDYVYSNGSFTPSTITVTGNQTLYAVWEEAILYMQDVANWMDNLELEQQVQAIDTRDNKLYWVAKLKDGNIWMTQNLDYNIVAGDNIISNNDGTTSIWNTSSTYAPRAITTTVFNDTSSTGTYSYDPGSKYIPNGTGTPTAITCTSASNGGENCHYHQGNYYQWNAATAGTGGTIANMDATSSICPKGWRLPISNSTNANYSFGNLIKHYGYTGGNQSSGATDTAILASPLFFVRGGSIVAGLFGSLGNIGYYWPSSAGSNTNNGAYILHFANNIMYPSNYSYRERGFSVRCVAIDPTLNGISTMQEMTPAIVAATPENTSKQLIDTRDDKLYWVTKLADGNIWMTQNLDYDITTSNNIVSNLDGTTSIWRAHPAATYAPQTTSTTVFNNSDDTGTYSYDPGSNYIPNGTGTPTAITCTSTSNGGENCHYHQGNYYQYNAATAGTGGTITNTDATSSICPKGWRLPTGNSYTENYSFGNLVKQYGYSGSNQDSISDSTLLSSPLFFVRGGSVRSGSLNSQSNYGYHWSSRAYSNTNRAYSLSFGSSRVYPSDLNSRTYGFSVRCVAL